MAQQSRGNQRGASHHRNTIGMHRHEVEAFLDRIDSMTQADTGSRSRAHARLPMHEAQVEICIIESDLSRRNLRMATRNISDGGISLLHSSYTHPGNRCIITLGESTDSGSISTQVPASIVKCVHLAGMVHEIGIRFDALIDARRYAAPAFRAGPDRSLADPKNLTGTILLIEDSVLDCRLVEHYLSATQIKIIKAETFEAARSRAHDPLDLILCDMMMPDDTPRDFVEWLRAQRIRTPLVLHTASSVVHVRQQMRDLEIQGLLLKPMLREEFLRSMTEYLTSSTLSFDLGAAPAKPVSGSHDSGAAKLFSSELIGMIGGLAKAISENDAMEVYTLSARLCQTARNLGFAEVAQAAALAARQTSSTMSCKESAEQIRALVESCQKARAA